LWTLTAALPVSASHPFYQRLNQILDEKKFDEYVEGLCGSNPNSSYSTNGNSGAILDSACKVGFSVNCSARPRMRLDAQLIVDGLDDPLPGAKVPLGSIYGPVSEQELNRLKLSEQKTYINLGPRWPGPSFA
jgi:hypothetical protein